MATTLPYRAYTSDDFLQSERDRIFSRSWLYVGHSGDLPAVGSWPTEVNGIPVVLTRSEAGAIDAFVNVCSHRGSVVCLAASDSDVLRCPYHAWRYGLDGALLSAPRSEREDSFDRDGHGLQRLPVGLWGPFVFINLDDAAAPFDEFLGDLPAQVADAGIDIDGLVFDRRSRSTIEANWKVCIENFLECYHCQVAHADFARTIDTSVDAYELAPHLTFSSQRGPVRQESSVIDTSGPITRSQFHLLYPNTVINILPGQPNLSIGPITPTSPTNSARFLDYFFTDGVDRTWVESMIAFDDQVGAEDVVLVQNVQRGLQAAPDRHGSLFMDSERLIAHFDAWVAAQIASPTG